MDPTEFLHYQAAIQRAENELVSGAHARAFESYKGLLAMRLEATLANGQALENAGDVLVTERLSQLALLFGSPAAADCLLDGLGGVALRAGNLYLADYTLLQRVHIALSSGRQQAAQCLLDTLAPSIGDLDRIEFSPEGLLAWEAECPWRRLDVSARSVLFSSFYLACGRLLAGEGLYTPAFDSLERGMLHCGPDAPDLARRTTESLLLAQATCRVEQGQLEAARTILDAAEPRVATSPQPAFRVRLLELRGKLALLQGDYGSALRKLEGVLDIARKSGFHAATLTATLNLAHVLTVVNQTAAAAALLEGARATAMARGDKASAVRVAVLARIGRLRGQSLADETAIAPSVNEMWEGPIESDPAPVTDDVDPELLPQEASCLAFFEVRALAVHWHLGHGRLVQAKTALGAIARTFGHSDSPLIALRIQVLEGMVDHYSGDWNDAVAKLDVARRSAAALGLDGELREIVRRLAAARARQGAPAAKLRELANQADRLLQAQADSLGGAERALYLLNKWTADEEALLLAVHEVQELERAAGQAGWMRRLTLGWRIRDRLARLAGRIDRHKALIATKVLQPTVPRPDENVGMKLRHGGLFRWRSATLAFLVLPDRTVTIRSCGLGLSFSVTAVTRLRLREIVGQWHTSRNGGADLSRTLSLDSVLAGLPPRVTSLRIIADDILHGVPFAALPYHGRFWAERYAVVTDFESAPPRVASTTADGLMLLAGVSRACGEFPPLPGVRGELTAVATALATPTKPLLDAEVSRTAMLSLWPGAALVHMACHGVFTPDRPDDSGLVLMPVPGKSERLTLRDLARLDLCTVRHVTLSSCWGADSFIAPGRWIISLPETLVRAGCGSVLAALWPVDDAATASFMADFYAHLKTQRRDRALQLAQLARLKAGGAAADPWTWAGFVLYGDGGRLRVRSHSNPVPKRGGAA